ncbi:MAG: hypothetical protein GC161_07815 [Planctomycetaceae bacterium]|nr:hypothetical protein [Planctomycetaceae bacterium]
MKHLIVALGLLPFLAPDRERAAERIREALEPEATVELTEAARVALEELKGSRVGTRLQERLSTDTDLRASLALTLEELDFRPTFEGDMPVGWPEPTQLEEIEVKRYPVTRLARAEMGAGSFGPFMSLFRHISQRDIAMTVPVEMELEGERAREVSMGFLYQGTDVGKLESDGTVRVIDVAPATFVSLGQRGNTSAARTRAALDELRAYVAARDHLAPTGSDRVLEYNGPSVRGNRRYYEVQMGVLDLTVAAFATPSEVARWTTVDDRVMGGVSQSRLVATGEGTARFEGVMSLESNGGFASVRSAPDDWIAKGTEALRLWVRGDGKTYQLRLRTNDAFDGTSYAASFVAPAGEWTEVSLPLADFRPSFRGREVRAEPLVPEKVRTLGLMLSDGQAGEFALEIAWIRRVPASESK